MRSTSAIPIYGSIFAFFCSAAMAATDESDVSATSECIMKLRRLTPNSAAKSTPQNSR